MTPKKTEYFPQVPSIQYEGPKSDNPLAYRWYNEKQKLRGKTLKEHLRFAVAYWHSFCGTGSDPFGGQTLFFPWNDAETPLQAAEQKLDAAFEFFVKLGVPYYCFHDRDIAPEGETVAESAKNLEHIVKLAKKKQKESGVKLLWGTANCFSHPRYRNGAATSPDFQVVTHAAAQVKSAIEATKELGGANYVFWGGREGYLCLQNTDMKREREHMAMFLTKARDYARSIGFKGPLLIEPKPMEPTKHQYDYDSATVIGFLREFNLLDDFKLNIEANHATLAGHDFAHELQVAADAGLLGSIDANRGDPINGWDTDEFPTDLYDAVKAMMVVLKSGGLGKGGLNFDAKLRRNSTDLKDLFYGHIAGMDTFAKALLIADDILKSSGVENLKKKRYSSFDRGDGKKFETGKLSLDAMATLAEKKGEPKLASGSQELIEMLINRKIF